MTEDGPVQNNTAEEPSRTALDIKVAEALIEGLKHRDFSHWKRYEDSMMESFLLELGHGYRLIAGLDQAYFGCPTYYRLFYNGNSFMFCFSGERVSPEWGIRISSDNSRIDLSLPEDFDVQGYAMACASRVPRKPITTKDFEGNEVVLDAFRARRKYLGIHEDAVSAPFHEETIDGLLYAVFTRDFSKLIDLECGIEDESDEPASLSFYGTQKAELAPEVRCRVSSGNGHPVDFWMEGVLTIDGDGVLIRGESAAFTVKVSDDDYRRFFEKHPEIPTDESYLESHPAPSYQYLASDDLEEIRAMLGQSGRDEE